MDFFTLDVDVVNFIHDEILQKEPGLHGGDLNKLSSVLSRIGSHHHYNGFCTIYEIAALYAFSIAQGHPFNDANKRTAFLSVYIFLYINGYHLTTKDYTSEIEDLMVSIANKEISPSYFQDWLIKNTKK